MPPTDQLSDFIAVVDYGSFTSAAERIGVSPSSLSRSIARLEDQIGFKLLHRTTRSLSLTREGSAYLKAARDVVGQLARVENALVSRAASTGSVRGSVRISAGTAYAQRILAPNLPIFLEAHPDIDLDLNVTDRRIDPIADQVDVTIRVGPLAQTDLIGIELGKVRRVIAASPYYLARKGTPTHPRDLQGHTCLQLSGFRRLAKWPMIENGKPVALPVTGSVTADSAELLLALAIAGAGIIRFGDFLGAEAIQDGRLVPLLEESHDADPQPITALIPRERRGLPAVDAFLSFLKAIKM